MILGLGFVTTNGQAEPIPKVEIKHHPDYPTGKVLIGEEFKFIVEFWNDGTAAGKGPFVDLFAEYKGADGTTDSGPCDGIEILSAEIDFANPPSYQVTAENASTVQLIQPSSCPSTGSFSHPFGADTPSSVPEGFQGAIFALPFTDYSPDQIPVKMVVTAKTHMFADPDVPLKIFARGGFKNGNVAPIASTSLESISFTPKVFIVSKKHPASDCQCKCTHCADETVTGPNHPNAYTIEINVAENQTIENVKLEDHLAPAIQFSQDNQGPLPGQGVTPSGWDYPDPSEPGGELILGWDHIEGGPGLTPEASVKYKFVIPEVDANGDPIVIEGCEPQVAKNKIKAKAQWEPEDPRDVDACDDTCVVSAQTDHELELKCLALQKTVELFTDDNHSGITPGDVLKYTLNFQISDYTVFDNVLVEDFLSDGQSYVDGSAELDIQDPAIGAHSGIQLDSYLEEDTDPFTHQCPVYGGTCTCGGGTAPIAGGTYLGFHVYDALGVVVGANELTGSPGGIPAEGTITYRVRVDDVFGDFSFHQGGMYESHSDPEVDKLDPLLDCARIEAEQLEPVSSSAIEDGTYTCERVVGDTLYKSIYRVYRPRTGEVVYSNSDHVYSACDADVFPGDQVTYRIHKTIPSCDTENLEIKDWLPGDAFDVGTGTAWGYDSSGPSTATPSPKYWKLGPGHSAPAPTGGYASILSVNSIQNLLTFDYGTIVDQGNNESCTIDILFTVEITDAPLPDETPVVNPAQECEDITYAEDRTFCQMAISEFTLREPELHITKGVVSANPYEDPEEPGYGTFDPVEPSPPFAFPCVTDPGAAAFDPVITSDDLDIDIDLNDVDAGDLIKYAIVVENQGGAPAFDVRITDNNPAAFYEEPGCGFNLAVTDGTGDNFVYSPDTWPPPSGGLELEDPGPTDIDTGALDGYSPSSGRNLGIITYDLHIPDGVLIQDLAQCCKNTAKLMNYASVEDGQNFVGENLVDSSEEDDQANVCNKPDAKKCVIATSESHTGPESGTTVDATIGEIVRYRLMISIPEGTSPNLKIVDNLAPGLAYMNESARYMFVYDNPGALNSDLGSDFVNNPIEIPTDDCTVELEELPLTIAPDSQTTPLPFEFGTVKNLDNDPNKEYLIIEFNAIVKNISANNDGTLLDNYYEVLMDGQSVVTSEHAKVNIVEPNLSITKNVATVDDNNDGCPDPGIVECNVEISNPVGGITAFDIEASDPQCTPSPSWSLGELEPGETETYTCQMVFPGDCCDLINTAEVIWTSLPEEGTYPNPTGSQAGASGTSLGERNYAEQDSAELCGKIKGVKFNDNVNTNGEQESGEPGLQGWTITATDADGCEWTAITDTDGSYTFCLPPGTYTVEEDMQSGWVTSSGPSISHVVDVTAGQSQTDIDFANVKCECGDWDTVDVEAWSSQSATPDTWAVDCGDTIQLTHDQAAYQVTVTSNLDCENCSQSTPTYSWHVETPGIGIWDDGNGNESNFATSSFDQATAVLQASCDGIQCSSCDMSIEYLEGPDLIVDNFVFTANCVARVRICNIGDMDATNDFQVSLYPVQGQSGPTVTSNVITGLGADDCTYVTLYNLTVLNSEIDVHVDPQGNVDEVNENNNESQFTVPNDCQDLYGTICGTKFNDCDGDGTQDSGDSGEIGIEGWPIYIDQTIGGYESFTLETGPDGNYCQEVPTGTYEVSEMIPNCGWSQTYPQGNTGQNYHEVTVSAGSTETADFGNQAETPTSYNSYVEGLKFNDSNGNGTHELTLNETGIESWKIWALDICSGLQVAVTATNGGGEYHLALPPGTYIVQEADRSGWTCTAPSPDCEHIVTLFNCYYGLAGINFGNTQSKGDNCGHWTDSDGDGTGELHVEGKLVDIDGGVELRPKRIKGPVTINPGYQSSPSFTGLVLYSWNIKGPERYYRSSGQSPVGSPIEFRPDCAGTYTATIIPHCGGESCKAGQMKIMIVKRKLAAPTERHWVFAVFETGGHKRVNRVMPESLVEKLDRMSVHTAKLVSSMLPTTAKFELELSEQTGKLTGVIPREHATYKLVYQLYKMSGKPAGELHVWIKIKGEK